VFDIEMIWPYLAAFGGLLGSGMGLPIPEELPVVGAGIWAAGAAETHSAWRFLILLVCILGVVISDVFLFCAGRYFGVRVLEIGFFRRLVPPEKRHKIEDNFHTHGIKILLFARLLPGIRAPIFIMAGVMRLPVRKFVLADGIYAIPGVTLLFFLAYWFRGAFEDLILAFEHRVGQAKPILILVALALVVAYMLYKFLRKPVSDGDPQQIPMVAKVTEAIEEALHVHHHPEGTPDPVPADGQPPVKQH
jgi:membrane protein DedA with SNARE-associated domain